MSPNTIAAPWTCRIRGEGVTPMRAAFRFAAFAAVVSIANAASAQVQQVVAWGSGAAATVPVGINNHVVKIAAGGGDSMAILGNGSVVWWGVEPVQLPSGNDFVDIATSGGFGVALRSNGGVACFTTPAVGGGTCNASPAVAPLGSRCSAGSGTAAIIGPGGAIIGCWGFTGNGNCSVPQQSWVQLDHGWVHGIGLSQDGSVHCWPQNFQPQTIVPPKLTALRIAAGPTISGALRTSGTVAVWGYTQLGGTNIQPPADLVDVVDLAIGDDHFVALRQDGTIRCWGYNGAGQCNVPAGLNRVVAIAAGQHHTVAMRTPCFGDVTANGITDGVDLAAVLAAWGTSGQGQFDCDVNNDGTVNGADLAMVLGDWGPCP